MPTPTVFTAFLASLLFVLSPLNRTDGLAALAPGQDKASPMLEVPLERLVNRPLVRITVNGKGPFPFLIDAEIPRTLIDRKFAESLKLKIPKNKETPLVLELGVGSSTIPMVPADVGDTAAIVPELGPAARPSGILTLDLWREQLVTINYRRWRMEIEPGALRPSGRDTFTLTPPSRQLFVPLSIGGRQLMCHVDPWFTGGLLMPSAYLTQLPLAGQPRDGGTVSTRAGELAVREVNLSADAVVGGFVFSNPLVQFGGTDQVATMGSRWLTDFLITYDPANTRIRLERQRP
jgi:hypothetical protein